MWWLGRMFVWLGFGLDLCVVVIVWECVVGEYGEVFGKVFCSCKCWFFD